MGSSAVARAFGSIFGGASRIASAASATSASAARPMTANDLDDDIPF
jgi:hypothetical protein